MINSPVASLREVESILVPAPGTSVEQALADASLDGYEYIDVYENHAVIRWYTAPEVTCPT